MRFTDRPRSASLSGTTLTLLKPTRSVLCSSSRCYGTTTSRRRCKRRHSFRRGSLRHSRLPRPPPPFLLPRPSSVPRRQLTPSQALWARDGARQHGRGSAHQRRRRYPRCGPEGGGRPATAGGIAWLHHGPAHGASEQRVHPWRPGGADHVFRRARGSVVCKGARRERRHVSESRAYATRPRRCAFMLEPRVHETVSGHHQQVQTLLEVQAGSILRVSGAAGGAGAAGAADGGGVGPRPAIHATASRPHHHRAFRTAAPSVKRLTGGVTSRRARPRPKPKRQHKGLRLRRGPPPQLRPRPLNARGLGRVTTALCYQGSWGNKHFTVHSPQLTVLFLFVDYIKWKDKSPKQLLKLPIYNIVEYPFYNPMVLSILISVIFVQM